MKNRLVIILSVACFASCADNGVIVSEEENGQAIVNEITVAKGTRADTVADDEEDILTENNFNKNSILYISQMGTELEPGFDQSTSSNTCPLYRYQWYENNEANWYTEYNFKPVSGTSPMDWSVIKSYGNVGNAFSLYAMYFPEDQKVRFSVEADQTGGENDQYDTKNFKKSDIMGAYHATSALYTRPRFRLFHLMVYLRVTIYVPVFNGETSDDYTKQEFSGFLEGAMQKAIVRNAKTDFNIEWRANRSSDTDAPLTQAAENPKQDIKMYHHKADESIIEEFDVTKYYKNDKLSTDKVRKYEFSVLFPAQTFGDNFLYFVLKAPDQSSKYYYFSGSQIIGESGNYSLTQGTLQHLYLYLPRNTNETILIGAKILPWNNAVTDMTVTQDTEQNENNGLTRVLK